MVEFLATALLFAAAVPAAASGYFVYRHFPDDTLSNIVRTLAIIPMVSFANPYMLPLLPEDPNLRVAFSSARWASCSRLPGFPSHSVGRWKSHSRFIAAASIVSFCVCSAGQVTKFVLDRLMPVWMSLVLATMTLELLMLMIAVRFRLKVGRGQ